MRDKERDFAKRVHDNFVKDIEDIEKTIQAGTDMQTMSNIFEKILKTVIDSIILNETNPYQYFDYKSIMLTKLLNN